MKPRRIQYSLSKTFHVATFQYKLNSRSKFYLRFESIIKSLILIEKTWFYILQFSNDKILFELQIDDEFHISLYPKWREYQRKVEQIFLHRRKRNRQS